MKLIAPLAASSIAFAMMSPASADQRNWIDRYIAAHGHCTQQPTGPYSSVNPLEKPIEEWSSQDLADLKAALNRCEALPEEETGVARMWTGAVYDSIASLVRAQQAKAAQQAEAKQYAEERAAQDEARHQRKAKTDRQEAQARLSALQRAAEQEAADRKAADERTKAVVEEEAAARQLAKAAEARAKAAQAEAQARSGVNEARERAARAEAAARRSEQRADADRQSTDRRFAEAYPTTQAPNSRASDGQIFELRERTVGCTSKGLFDQTLAAIEAHEMEHAAEIAAKGQEQGLCGYVQPGSYVLKERNIRSACVTPAGSSGACSWIFNFLTK